MADSAIDISADVQPDLPMADLPRCEGLVEMVRARSFLSADSPVTKRFRRTGKLLIRSLRNDTERAEAICLALRLDMSARLIARRFNIAPESVQLVRDAMTERGELRAVRLRVDRLLDRFIELGLERMVEGCANGEIHPGQISIPVLAALDKKSQRDAGVVLGTERTQEDVGLERVEAALALIRLRLAPPSEALSEGSSKNANVIEVSVTLDTSQDTAAPAHLVAEAPGADGGGGGSASGGGPGGRGVQSSKILG